MKSKKCISKIILTMTILAILYTIPAAASNYTDTVYNFYFKTGAGGVAFTERREKQDDSSAYMKCEEATYSYNAMVVGSQYVGDNYYDASGGHKYTFDTGITHKMINYVYERNYKYASIYAKRDYSYNYSAHGLWSPDSI